MGLTLLMRPAAAAAGDLFVRVHTAVLRPERLRNSHRGPLTRWKHSYLHVSKVGPVYPFSYAYHGTIKSYRELCSSRDLRGLFFRRLPELFERR